MKSSSVIIRKNEKCISIKKESIYKIAGNSDFFKIGVFGSSLKISFRSIFHALFDHRALIQGDWKIVSDWGAPWRLINLAEDRTELNDLSSKNPEQFSSMKKEFERWWSLPGKKNLNPAGTEPVYIHRNP